MGLFAVQDLLSGRVVTTPIWKPHDHALLRELATRYDKLAERFASFVALTAAFIWLA